MYIAKELIVIQIESGGMMTGLPKYRMVKEKIKEWITNGEVQPGEKIHSENDLVKLFQVSRHTVPFDKRSAISFMKADYIAKKERVLFVRSP